ncbi:transposase [Paracraurococcus lichenis]|uniref:Transposase n=1 Tax=Paracraurococcus lichenis TaxID=3064888 RepID=A0ABT9E2H9_9PROT|nr:transposase [Paracraurococcus sp. LOR1-02]MDO9710377.1 transposase [Paracraurococcus sp. LOR1-02]
MRTLSPSGCDWSSVVATTAAVVDLEATARSSGALRRARKIRRAEELLRLALLYGPGGLSLSGAAAAGDAGIACLSDKAVLGRLRRCGDWLALILARLLAARRGLPAAAAEGAGVHLALVDSTVICRPGSTGSDWRLQARYDPARGRFVDLSLGPGQQAERVDRTAFEAGTTTVVDRGYGRARDIRAAITAGSDIVSRIGWRSLALLDLAGQRFDLMAHLPQGQAPVEHPVRLRDLDRPLRLVIARIPPEKQAEPQRRLARRASRKGQTTQPGTAIAAGYLMLLTSLPATTTPEQVVTLYRSRWQVELGFKRLKTLGRLDALPASDPDLARSWLLAHLIAAVLTEDIATAILAFPPSAAA